MVANSCQFDNIEHALAILAQLWYNGSVFGRSHVPSRTQFIELVWFVVVTVVLYPPEELAACRACSRLK
ncbi:MAG: hypothetical protein KAJ01_01835, partial [Candidatus Hydrogenedentes bacterium]|nr:hypothetical protein [Candidatus Hydrogenedentota bacterium]